MTNVIQLVKNVMKLEMEIIINVLNAFQHMNLRMILKMIIIAMKNVIIIIILIHLRSFIVLANALIIIIN